MLDREIRERLGRRKGVFEVDRVIFHCDCNGFYASVELLEHPELQDKPVAVCGDPKSRHGIILAKNERAKGFGIKTAETIWQARKKCPDLVLLPAHHDKYRAMSKRVNTLYERFTDLVEPFGIDESWLDVTGTLHLFGGDSVALADRIRGEVLQRAGPDHLRGRVINKIFCKLGSDYKKPRRHHPDYPGEFSGHRLATACHRPAVCGAGGGQDAGAVWGAYDWPVGCL